MPDLIHSLQNRDLGHLRIVAGLWGLEVKSPETDAALKELSAALLDPDLMGEIIGSLSLEAGSALEALMAAGGKMPWAAFVRQFGELREAGPGRRDREQIYLQPVSAAETLFYRALLARAFFDTPNGLQEFAYIPEDLLNLIQHEGHKAHEASLTPSSSPAGRGAWEREAPLGRLASPKERARPLPASDCLLDDATTLLAALRMDITPPETAVPVNVAGDLLRAAGILAGNEPAADKVRTFLEAPRPQALALLAEAWQKSESFNELRQIPGLVCEGEWTNSPLAARCFLLGLLDRIPKDRWWSLAAFVHDVRQKHPDFQRPAGDYDSWFVKRAADGVYLRGFAAWDEVDGALIRYLVTGPMFWLGRVELALAEGSDSVAAFRLSGRQATSSEDGKLTVTSNGRISVPRLVPRVARYLISRFCEWEEGGRAAPKGRIEATIDEYRYRVTTASLKKAAGQGLKVGQLLSLLAKSAAAEIPPAFVKSLKRWEMNGSEARIEVQTVLRVSRPEVLDELRRSKAGRFLGESLGPVTVIVKPGAQSKVLAALAELGLLAEEVEEHQGNG